MLALALLLAQSPAQPQVQTSTPPEFTRDSSSFGNIVAAAGDQDGDGTPDCFVGEEQDSGKGLDGWIFSGKDGSTIRSFRLRWDLESIIAVECGPDVDGDQVRDFLVIARPFSREHECNLWLISGRTGSELWRATSEATRRGKLCARFIRDADGDGVDDIALLDPRSSLYLAFVRLRSGKTGKPIQGLLVPNARRAYAGSLAEIDDLDGDGHGELAVLLDGEGITHPRVRAWSRSKSGPLWTMRSPDKWAGTTGALACLGDLNQDGVHDLAAAFNDTVCVLSGRDGKVLLRLVPKSKSDYVLGFGTQIAALEDVNGDGVGDLVLSQTEPAPTGDTSLSGSVRAYSGKDGKLLWVSSPVNDEGVDEFGTELEPIGDVNNDGVTDLIVGSWEGSSGCAGYAALLSGKTGATLFDFRRATSGIVVRKAPTSPTRFR